VPVTGGTSFYTLAPCRLLDTRKMSGPDAAFPALAAKALSVNATAVAAVVAGNLVIYPANDSGPLESLLNLPVAAARGNNAIVNLPPDGTIKVLNRANGTVDFILDVNGYFH